MEVLTLRTDEDIEQTINKYSSTVYSIAMTRLKSRSDADDVFQEVFLTMCRKRPSFESEEHLKAWIIKTTLNYCKRITMSTWRRKTSPLEEVSDRSYQFYAKEENDVYNAVSDLPKKYRTIIVLYYFEDISVKEISSILHIREGTVRMQLTRARNILKTKLKGDYFYE